MVGVGFGFEVITFGLLILQARTFERFGYNLNLLLAGVTAFRPAGGRVRLVLVFESPTQS